LYATVHGQRLEYERRRGGLRSVVFLHGLGDDRSLWRHQLAPVSERYNTIAVDLRGHGASAPSSAPFTVEDMAADVEALVRRLNLPRPVIVGLSMGGGVAQALAIHKPTLLAGLVLVSTSSHFPEATRDRMLRRADHAEHAGMAAVIDETVPRWFTPGFSERRPDDVARTRQTVLGISPSAFAAASRANAARDHTASLHRITCPVLFIGGLEDPADPARALRAYRQHLVDLRVELLPDASHLVPIEAPQQFTAILLRFLDECEHQSTLKGGDR
jgi:3-oxoadipate enol-lactonase